MKKLYVSPFNEVDGYYLVRAPLPDAELDVTISLHRDNQPAFVATLRGEQAAGRHRRDPASAAGRAAGTADGGVGNSGSGHHAVAAPGSGGAAQSEAAESERVEQP